MTATTQEPKYSADKLAQFRNKRVKVVVNLPEKNEKGELAVEMEGTVQAGNELGLLIKPKGKVKFELIERGLIEEIVLVTEKSSELERTSLKPVKIGQARRHLMERHGYTLSQANALTEEEAMEIHEKIDHEADDLGHIHSDKSTEKATDK